jgi:hypothetical protein
VTDFIMPVLGVATRAEAGTTFDLGVRLAHPVPMIESQRFPAGG